MAEAPFIVGWQEWIALPGLGLPAIKAKIDSGARSSALHAFRIEPFGPATRPMVRFGVHPIPGRRDVEIYCSAPIVDHREVTSSNGEKELRTFIRTPLSLGGRTWDIEIGLTNRETMSYRMLLGRQALGPDMMIDAAGSWRQPRLSYRLYRDLAERETPPRTLRIALVARAPSQPSDLMLERKAAARGHVLERIDLRRISLSFDDTAPGLYLDGARLHHYDAVIPRVALRDGAFGAAVIRQLEAMGAYALNTGDALDMRANRLATLQALARARLPAHLARRTPDEADDDASTADSTPRLRFLLVDSTAAAALMLHGDRISGTGLQRHRAERRLAEKAADALRLGLCSLDVEPETDVARPRLLRVSARPALSRFARSTGVAVTDAILDALESHAPADVG